VFFEQVAVPGREAAIDFTHATDLGVTIAGDPFPLWSATFPALGRWWRDFRDDRLFGHTT
jgi:hypothetical protein